VAHHHDRPFAGFAAVDRERPFIDFAFEPVFDGSRFDGHVASPAFYRAFYGGGGAAAMIAARPDGDGADKRGFPERISEKRERFSEETRENTKTRPRFPPHDSENKV
jgi:hypothetical protein